MNKLIQVVQETIKLQNATIDAAAKAINVNLQRFLKEDVKQMKDTRGYFNKISNDLDGALNKNAGASKSRPTEVEDATNFLTATQGCFRYTTLDYVYQVQDTVWKFQDFLSLRIYVKSILEVAKMHKSQISEPLYLLKLQISHL